MNIKIKEVRQIKITELLDLDPITVYMDEWEKEETDGTTRYQGRITIVCYDTVLSYYWGSMGSPLKEFFCDAPTDYIAGKFMQSSYSSYCPEATEGSYDENGKWEEKEISVQIGMSNTQQEYIKRIINTVKEALREIPKQDISLDTETKVEYNIS